MNDSERVFSQKYVDACATVHPGEQPEAGARYVFGVDWARGIHFTCIAVLDATRQRLVALDRFRETAWAPQYQRLLTLHAYWKPDAIWAEANSIGGPGIERMQAEGLPVIPLTLTSKTKGPIMESLARAIIHSELALLRHSALLTEMNEYRVRFMPDGNLRFEAPVGSHDDCIDALALAWFGASRGGAGISFV